MPALEVGKKVPNLSALTTKEKTVNLADLSGKKGLVVYFYPKDMTPGCTTEACDFRDNFARLKKLGFSVVGVSKDSAKSHQKFTEKEELNFELLADESKEICEAFGVWREKVFMGKKGMGIVRSTFILNTDLKVLKIYDNVKAKGHVDQIISDLEDMK